MSNIKNLDYLYTLATKFSIFLRKLDAKKEENNENLHLDIFQQNNGVNINIAYDLYEAFVAYEDKIHG